MDTLTRRRLLQASPLALLPPTAGAQRLADPPAALRRAGGAGRGILDIMARLIGHQLAARLGQQVVIENKPGAANNSAPTSSPARRPTATRC